MALFLTSFVVGLCGYLLMRVGMLMAQAQQEMYFR